MRFHSMARRASQNSAELSRERRFRKLAASLAAMGREFHARGWALGTSGNFSAVLSRRPLRLAVTPTGADKSALAHASIVEVDAAGQARNGFSPSRKSPPKLPAPSSENASAETLLHLTVARVRGAGAVLHTHSIWGTVLSAEYARRGGIALEGYEMLKGLAGVHTHEHREWLPILENRQDMKALAGAVQRALDDYPASHGFLLRGHGLYTWGRDLAEAKRHVEILEFLLEVLGRRLSVGSLPSVDKTSRPESPRRSKRRNYGTAAHPG